MPLPQPNPPKKDNLSKGLIGGGLLASGLSASLLPTSTPFVKILGRENKAYNKIRSGFGKPAIEPNQRNADFVADYLEGADQGFRHPIGQMMRQHLLNKRQAGKGNPWMLDHYLRFSAGKNRALDHWLYELNVNNDSYETALKNKIVEHASVNPELAGQSFENIMAHPTYGPFYQNAKFTIPTTDGKKTITNSYGNVQKQNADFGDKYKAFKDNLDKNVWNGSTEDQGIRQLGQSQDPRVKQLLKLLAVHKAKAVRSFYGKWAAGAHGLGLAGLGSIGVGAYLAHQRYKQQIKENLLNHLRQQGYQ